MQENKARADFRMTGLSVLIIILNIIMRSKIMLFANAVRIKSFYNQIEQNANDSYLLLVTGYQNMIHSYNIPFMYQHVKLGFMLIICLNFCAFMIVFRYYFYIEKMTVCLFLSNILSRFQGKVIGVLYLNLAINSRLDR